MLCQKLSRKERAQWRARGGNSISVGQIHTGGPSDIPNTHMHTWTTSEVGSVFSEWWINMNSVSKLPSLRHFPTNRLNTLCSVIPPPPSCLLPTPSLPLCLSPSVSLSLLLPIQLIFYPMSVLLSPFIPLFLPDFKYYGIIQMLPYVYIYLPYVNYAFHNHMY